MTNIKKILIANRGEIACRIIKACQELNIISVAVYSDFDQDALHVKMADESYYIGKSEAKESYLNQEIIIQAALESNADAIHPGYGFLSENSEFNKKVVEAGLIFIGPNPEAMRILGSKVESRITMINSGVPVVPGMKSSSLKLEDFISTAKEIGYPVIIKSSAGGGGKGMRIINSEEELPASIESAIRESEKSFGSNEIFLEKYIAKPRHIEVQVVCDKHGNAIHLYERECSIQRRHQKIIEETPSVALNSELREKMGEAAIKAVLEVSYDSVATVEFLLDDDGKFYFLEVNTRVQVEHPITEEVVGIDIVKLQIEIADGKTLSIKQEDVEQKGHAIECRIYAEDGDNNFMPSTGKILKLNIPSGIGIRYESGIYEGCEVGIFYDPILSKLITKGKNREEARLRMINALKSHVILGIKTSIGLMIDILESEEFINGETYTNLIATKFNDRTKSNHLIEMSLISALTAFQNDKTTSHFIQTSSHKQLSTWELIGKWQIGESI